VGDVATSTRTITLVCLPFYFFQSRTTYADLYTQEILKKLYNFNGNLTDGVPIATHFSNDLKTKCIHEWGGPTTRLALHAIYTLAFICLLCSDEVLKIRQQDIKLVKEDDQTVYMIITLPFRKTGWPCVFPKSKFIHLLTLCC